jgi:hypothetical protein
MTSIVVNGKAINFTLPPTYADGKTVLPPALITGIKIAVGTTSGGPYTKTVLDTNLVPVSGVCSYPLSSLGVDLTVPSYAVLYTEIAGAESVASKEVGFVNLAPLEPQSVSVL